MTSEGGLGNLWIVGTGRLGPALGVEILRAGGASHLTFLGRSPHAPHLPVLTNANVGYVHVDAAGDIAAPDTVLIAVPDGSIRAVSASLASLRIPPVVAIHTSGALSAAELSDLNALRWRTGSVHPLVAIPDAVESAKKLRGAWFGIEGDEEAVAAGRYIISLLGGHALFITAEQKPLYHAAAVMASNYVVALLDVAVGLLSRSGLDPADAANALGRLAEGAAADVAETGSRQALTGPLLRGDVGTIRLHMNRLSREETQLYSVLAREALRIATDRGLSAETASAVDDILREADG